MPNRPISFEFIADVAQYLREVKKMEVSTDDVAEALLATSTSSQELEKKLSRAMRDAKKETDLLEKSIGDIPKATKEAARGGGSAFRELGDDAADAGREVGSEFRQNIAESLGSGDFEGLVQGTLGGIAGSVKGAFAPAFAGIAGLAAIQFMKIKENWEKTQAAIAATSQSFWSEQLGALGDAVGEEAIVMDNAYLAAQEVKRLWADEEGAKTLEKLVKSARELGINANDVVLARAGDEAAIKRVKAALDEVYRTQVSQTDATKEEIGAYEDISHGIRDAGTALDENKAKVDAYNASLAPVAEAAKLISDRISAWKLGVQQTADELETLRAGFFANPNDWTIRLYVDASALQQYFPYGTVASGSGGTPYSPRSQGSQ